MAKYKGKQFKVYSRAYRERCLAKLTSYSSTELFYGYLNMNNLKDEVNYKKSKFMIKVLNKIQTKVDFTNKLIEKMSQLSSQIINESDPKVKANLEKQLNKLSKEYTYALSKSGELVDFMVLARISCECVAGGEVAYSDWLDTGNYNYIYASDILKLASKFDNFSEDLSYVFYRALYVSSKMDIPLPVTQKQYSEFLQATEFVFGNENYFKSIVRSSPFAVTYDYGVYSKEKELYEAVFPEFGFKYEDRHRETPIYKMEFSSEDFYDDYR